MKVPPARSTVFQCLVRTSRIGMDSAGASDFDAVNSVTFLEAESDPHRNAHKNCAEQERDSPSPGVECIVVHEGDEGEIDEIGHQYACGNTDLWCAAVQPLLALRCVFGGDQNCAAPLAADTESLNESQGHQEYGGKDADSGVVG